jgi:50S ribosomal protein L16 3-hydroxylase
MPDSPANILGNINSKIFLKDYWQKKPLLIRQAIPGYHCPLRPEELAGLACEEEVSSRLVIEKHGTHPWQVKYGPLKEKDFKKLPQTHWTLLVQEVDHYHPGIRSLLDYFSFIPNWRIDDVMISYAPAHGSVGPHLDSYDVFLLQGLGRRRWQINADDYTEADFVPGLELRILKKFRAKQEWILEPGDMLYLPPGVAHHGIALDSCLTLSIGFLAPTRSELITHFAEEMIAGTAADLRYSDADLRLQEYPGEITGKSLASIRKLMRAALRDDTALNRWFGKFITTVNNQTDSADTETVSKTAFTKLYKRHEIIYRNHDSRCSFIRDKNGISLFLNGRQYSLEKEDLPVAALITERSFIHFNELSDFHRRDVAMDLLRDFYQRGFYYFDE